MSGDRRDADLPGAARELAEWRKAQHLTQLQLSHALGYATSQSVSNLESGRMKPSLDRAVAIWQVSGIEPWLWFSKRELQDLHEPIHSAIKAYDAQRKYQSK